jgi:hypothetical protein
MRECDLDDFVLAQPRKITGRLRGAVRRQDERESRERGERD